MSSVRSGEHGKGLGETVVVGALWAAVLVAVVVTYARVDPAELYHVSREGLGGGLSRALVLTNFPLALVAIAIALLALARLPRRARLVGAPALLLCAVTTWPGVVEQDDLDARWVNGVPGLGVALALALGVAALLRDGAGLAGGRSLDPLRVALGVVTLAISIPWVAAEVGVLLPDGIFLMRRPGLEPDGSTLPAVHLGHHHGLDGALILVSALLLSRVERGTGRLAAVTTGYLGLALAYGAVNATQDAWNEQLVKRGTVDWKIPSALEPRPTAIWGCVLGLAAVSAWALAREQRADGG